MSIKVIPRPIEETIREIISTSKFDKEMDLAEIRRRELEYTNAKGRIIAKLKEYRVFPVGETPEASINVIDEDWLMPVIDDVKDMLNNENIAVRKAAAETLEIFKNAEIPLEKSKYYIPFACLIEALDKLTGTLRWMKS